MGQDMSREEEEQFYYRHKVEVHLSLMVADLKDSSKSRFAIQNNKEDGDSLPSIKLKAGGSPFDFAKQIFKRCTGSDSDWFVVKQVGVVEPEMAGTDLVMILYSIVVPEVIPLLDTNVRWAKYEELKDRPLLLGLTGLACNYNRVN